MKRHKSSGGYFRRKSMTNALLIESWAYGGNNMS